MTLQRRWAIPCIVMLATVTTPLLGALPKDPAALAPADAMVYIGITDIKQAQEGFEGTTGYKLMNDPVAKKAMEQFDFAGKAVEKIKERLAEALELEASQLENPFAGPMGIYLTLAEGSADGEDVEVALVAGIGDRALMQRYYRTAVRRLSEVADDRESASFRSHTIDAFMTEAAEDEEDDFDFDPNEFSDPGEMMDQVLDGIFSEDALPERFALCMTDELLLVGSSVDEIKRILRRERASSLARQRDYRKLEGLFEHAGPVRFWVNIPRIIEVESADEDADGRKMQAALGLDKFGPLIGHLGFGRGKLDYEYDLQLLLRSKPTGIAKILSMPNGPLSGTAYVPADASIAAALHINLGDVLDEVIRIMRQIDPDMAEQMLSGMENVPLTPNETINVRTEVVNNLRPPLAFSVGFKQPYDASSCQALLSLAHAKREILVKLMGMSPMFMGRDLHGAEVYDIPMAQGLALAITDKQFLAGSLGEIEAAVQGKEGDLASRPEFRAIAESMPEEAWLSVFVDSRRMMEATLGLVGKREELQQSMFTNPTAMITLGILQSFGEDFDEEDAAQMKKLLKYYAPAMFTIRSTPEGVHLRAAQAKPE